MALYLKAKRIDQETGSSLEAILNSGDANEKGINNGDIVSLTYGETELFVKIEITDSIVSEGHIGLYEDVWKKYRIPENGSIVLTLIERPKSVEFIKKKLLGEKLTKEELEVIMKDISERKIREVEIAYFMASFFNPGFDEDEVLWTAQGMAKAGDLMDFRYLNEKKMVVDKHSIGGIAAKGITPILVPTIASFGLIIPNTSTRAISTPAGTADILEAVMPVMLTPEQVVKTVEKTGACMIWGGALKLAPSDDVLIHVEKGLHVQSYQKLLVSIVAKKIAMGITHILIDIPFGPSSKVTDPDDVELLERSFKNLFKKVGIECDVYSRKVGAPDGNGVGPLLEVRDILKVLEQTDDRPKYLENVAADMAGRLLELVGYAQKGKGKQMALDKIASGETLKKFWEIAKAQGADKVIKSSDIQPGEFTHDVFADFEGEIRTVNNKAVVQVARALGNPMIKEAGIYFYKRPGDFVKAGDKIMTLYATSQDRLDIGKKSLIVEEMFQL